ncbi:helix-turn-helix transcriptional regulator [Streptomyces sp. NBC_01013]|uniref:helix-turn-helix transcriptional regulator n=1 Tax=Streptomyces sp. NBC_01013 TaxID=2903718 RepID=UPI003863B0D4|nr:helix-turn-helix transcriptional regulator [Streptomyces sp. NBC_01013]
MCHPAWGRARLAAQRLSDLARLRRIRDRIDREYARPLNVETLARDANATAGHLSREFRLAYGKSPYAYLMARRIERATALLRHGDFGVAEACRAVGCPSPGIFRDRFTELVGVPPDVYRHRATVTAAGMTAGVPKQATRPVERRDVPAVEPEAACVTGTGEARDSPA